MTLTYSMEIQKENLFDISQYSIYIEHPQDLFGLKDAQCLKEIKLDCCDDLENIDWGIGYLNQEKKFIKVKTKTDFSLNKNGQLEINITHQFSGIYPQPITINQYGYQINRIFPDLLFSNKELILRQESNLSQGTDNDPQVIFDFTTHSFKWFDNIDLSKNKSIETDQLAFQDQLNDLEKNKHYFQIGQYFLFPYSINASNYENFSRGLFQDKKINFIEKAVFLSKYSYPGCYIQNFLKIKEKENFTYFQKLVEKFNQQQEAKQTPIKQQEKLMGKYNRNGIIIGIILSVIAIGSIFLYKKLKSKN